MRLHMDQNLYASHDLNLTRTERDVRPEDVLHDNNAKAFQAHVLHSFSMVAKSELIRPGLPHTRTYIADSRSQQR